MATTSKRVDALMSVNVSSVRAGDEQPFSGAGPRQSRGARAAGACFHGLHCVVTIVLIAVVGVISTTSRDRGDLITKLQVRTACARRARRGRATAQAATSKTHCSRRAACRVAWRGADARLPCVRRTRRCCSRRVSLLCRVTRRTAACSAAAALGSSALTCCRVAACLTTAWSPSETTPTSSEAPASAEAPRLARSRVRSASARRGLREPYAPRTAGRIFRYDTIYGLWSASLPAMPVPYTRFGFAAGTDTIFVVGGIGGDMGTGACWDPTCALSGVNMATSDDVEAGNPGRTGWATLAYNITAGRWRTDLTAVRLNVPRADSCAAVINGKLYVVGASPCGLRHCTCYPLAEHAASLCFRRLF